MTGSHNSFLTPDISAILEKYKKQTLNVFGAVILVFLVGQVIGIHLEFNDDLMAIKRVSAAAVVIAITYYFLWRDRSSKRAGPFMVYGLAAVLILNRAIATPSMPGMFLNFPALSILAVLILGFRIGTALSVTVFSILMSVYIIALKSTVLPIVFVREPNTSYVSGPVLTLFLVIQIGRLLRELAREGMLSNQLLSQYVESHRHLFSVITHDLSNVLFVGILSWETNAKTRFEQTIDEMSELTQALKQIHEGVADQAPARNRVAVTDVIGTVQFVFSVHLKSKALKFAIDYGNAEKCFLWTSSPILTHVVLNNLVSNAIKFSPPDSVIRIRAAAAEGHVILEISDQGDGISEDTIKAIREDRQVSSRPGTRGELGTGFGLRNARVMARRLDIELELERAVPHGTVARLIIPRENESSRESEVRNSSVDRSSP